MDDLDRDLYQLPNNSLSLHIEACDSGQPRLCSVRVMTIRVTDVNDNSPVFSRPAYTSKISETAQQNDAVNVDGNVQVSVNQRAESSRLSNFGFRFRFYLI